VYSSECLIQVCWLRCFSFSQSPQFFIVLWSSRCILFWSVSAISVFSFTRTSNKRSLFLKIYSGCFYATSNAWDIVIDVPGNCHGASLCKNGWTDWRPAFDGDSEPRSIVLDGSPSIRTDSVQPSPNYLVTCLLSCSSLYILKHLLMADSLKWGYCTYWTPFTVGMYRISSSIQFRLDIWPHFTIRFRFRLVAGKKQDNDTR